MKAPSLVILLALCGCQEEEELSPAWQGEAEALVVLLEWDDAPAPADRLAVEDAMFTGDDSLRAWLGENSLGRFALHGEVLPWLPAGQAFDPELACEPRALLELGWQVAETAGAVDPSDHDADDTGRIDYLFVLHSGRGPNDRVSWRCMFLPRDETPWPTAPADRAVAMQLQGLGSVGDAVPVGLYGHEAGHRYFRFPDLYGEHYHGDYGIGSWGLMGLGQWGLNARIEATELWRHPSHLEPMHKVATGWIEPEIVAEGEPADLVLRPVQEHPDVVRIEAGDSTFWLEYRADRGGSAGLPGHGLLVWRERSDSIELIQADGRDDLAHGDDLDARPLPPNDQNFGDAGDPFPGSSDVREWADPESALRLEGIELDDEQVTLRVRWAR